MFGDAVIGPAVGMFAAMPALVLTSKLVPKVRLQLEAELPKFMTMVVA
jgi:biopolymer transport protein ExbB/TolQ